MPKVEKKDPYGVLDISREATEDEIKAAFKKMARRWHPDRHSSEKELAAQNFIKCHDAYKMLMDKKRTRRRNKASEGKASGQASGRSDSGNATPDANADAGSSSRQPSSPVPHAIPHTIAAEQSPASGLLQNTPLGGDYDSDSSSSTGTGSSNRSTSSINKASTRPTGDHAPPRPKTGDAHSEPSSSEPIHRPVPLQACERPQDVSTSPDVTSPDSPKSLSSIGSNRDALGSNKASAKLMVDDEPRSRIADTRQNPASPKPVHQLVSPHASGENPEDVATSSEVKSPDSPKSPAQKLRALLRKKRDSNPEPAPDLDLEDDTDGYVYVSHAQGIPTEPNGNDNGYHVVKEDDNLEPALRPLNSPLSSPREWLFPLELTLEELFHGTSVRFRITRRLLSSKTKQCVVIIDIPQGTRAGTKIRCPGVGHERKDGTRQDVIFLVKEKTHDRFQRVKDDLFLDVLVPYVDQLAEQGGDIIVEGIDGRKITVNIPYPIDQRTTDGKVIVKGAGMPLRKGRGELVVRWQVVFPSPTSKWDSLKKALHVDH